MNVRSWEPIPGSPTAKLDNSASLPIATPAPIFLSPCGPAAG